MSPADSADRPGPLRVTYGAELEQLRLQVEVMGVLVDQNLERMRQVLETGDPPSPATRWRADDDIDAMNVSLTERCYEVLGRENPMASDLRLVVSVIRVSSELERIGDLSLRVVRAGVDHDLLTSSPESFDVAQVMASEAIELVRSAMRAWATEDVDLAASLSKGSPSISLDLRPADRDAAAAQRTGRHGDRDAYADRGSGPRADRRPRRHPRQPPPLPGDRRPPPPRRRDPALSPMHREVHTMSENTMSEVTS